MYSAQTDDAHKIVSERANHRVVARLEGRTTLLSVPVRSSSSSDQQVEHSECYSGLL